MGDYIEQLIGEHGPIIDVEIWAHGIIYTYADGYKFEITYEEV